MTKEEVIGTLATGAKQIESILEEKFGARGKGLHTKTLSIQGHLGAALVKKIQYVATIRNKAMHEDDFQEVPFDTWLRVKKQVLAALEDLDPPERGSAVDVNEDGDARSSRGWPNSAPPRAGRILVPLFLVPLIAIAAVMFLGHKPSSTRGSGAPAVEADVPPLWSLSHPGHARQAFPWREEQSAFVAAGETGTLPTETMWKVTSPARQVKRKGGEVFLEVGIQLGGGKTVGKIFFTTHDSFGLSRSLKTGAHDFVVELATKQRVPPGIRGEALNKDGRMLGAFDPPFECRREIPNGCGEWTDKGVAFVALSTVSFGNALKLIDAPP